MKTLHSFIISTYLIATIIPVLLLGGGLVGYDMYQDYQREKAHYAATVARQTLEAKRALINFDLVASELVTTQVAQLNHIMSVRLISDLYGMTMSELMNTTESLAEGTLYSYPIISETHQKLGSLEIIKDETALLSQVISSTLPRALLILAILLGLGFLFSWIIISTLKAPFTQLQRFAFQITHGDYHTQTYSESRFSEISTIFKALEAMRKRLRATIFSLKSSQERYSRTYNLTQVCLFVIDVKRRKLIQSNNQFRQIFKQIPNETLNDITAEFLIRLLECPHTESFNYTLSLGEKKHHFQINRSELIDQEIECSALDITELVNAKQEAERQLITDALTKVPNRFCFNRFIAAVNQGKRRNVTLLMIDLNGFKAINDTYGHAAGDSLLIEMAGRFNSMLDRSWQTIYRLGGDEFIITLEQTYGEERVKALVAKLLTTQDKPIEHQGRHFNASMSIGVSHYQYGDSVGIEKAIIAADIAMYEAKANKLGVAYSNQILASTNPVIEPMS
jgi:diguanylate cyclase (GGDEF)-like protein